MCARFLSRIAEKMGATKLLSGSKDVTERILPVAAQFAVDGNQETRYMFSFFYLQWLFTELNTFFYNCYSLLVYQSGERSVQ